MSLAPALPNGVTDTLRQPISADGTPVLGTRYDIPARQGRAVRLTAGQTLRLITPHGTQVCDLFAFTAADLDEHLSMAHTRAALSRLVPRVGDMMVSSRRQAMLTLTADTSPSIHDTLIPACDAQRYRQLGVEGHHDNCADNLRLAMMAIGLLAPIVPQPLNVWMCIPWDADGTLHWQPPMSKPGDYIDMRAEVDCIAVMSACPQDLVPVNGEDCLPQPLAFEVHG